MTAKVRVSVSPPRMKLLNDQGTEGVLLGTRCRQCGEHFFGPVVFCQNCTSRDLEPVELSKQGTLYSYTIVRVPPEGWPGGVPYALGQVQLPEGPHVLSEVINCPYDELNVGMRLELAFAVSGEDPNGRGIVLYKWRRPKADPD